MGAIRIGTNLLLKSRGRQVWPTGSPRLGIFVVVEWRTDNWGAEQIVKWGSRSAHLNELAKKLWDMAWKAGFVWRPKWVPMEENVRADMYVVQAGPVESENEPSGILVAHQAQKC